MNIKKYKAIESIRFNNNATSGIKNLKISTSDIKYHNITNNNKNIYCDNKIIKRNNISKHKKKIKITQLYYGICGYSYIYIIHLSRFKNRGELVFKY